MGFGKVVMCPLAPKQTLTVVQPQEGSKLVADAYSRSVTGHAYAGGQWGAYVWGGYLHVEG